MKFEEFLKDKITRKYKEPEEVFSMIKNRTTDEILNPAYNKEYEAFIEKMREPLNKVHRINVVNIDGTNFIEPTITLVGTGGVGSNLLYMLRDWKNPKLVKSEKHITLPTSFYEFDEWEFDNLPRIPVKLKDLKIKKQHTFNKKGLNWGDSDEGEQNLLDDPLPFRLVHDKDIMEIFVGAPTLKTRKVLHEAKVPWIGITHKDDELKVVLNPSPVSSEDLAVETYGIVDINFLLPAIHIASFWLAQFMYGNIARDTIQGKLYQEIFKYKVNMYKRFNQIDSIREDAVEKLLKKYIKYHIFDEMDEPKKADPYDVRFKTYIRFWNYIADDEKYKWMLETANKTNYEIFEEPNTWYEKNTNVELLTIKKEDVELFLKEKKLPFECPLFENV